MRAVSRNLSLDVFRGVALLLVLFRHMGVCPASISAWAHAATAFLQRGGWAGVDLFFVLSGFLVGGLLFREYRATGKIAVGRFWVRRAFKILPLFLLANVVIVAVGRLWMQRPLTFSDVAPDLFFYSDYVPGLLGVGWSLSVEEHFYLLLPGVLALLLALRRPGEGAFQRFPLVVAGAAVACLGFRGLAFVGEASYSMLEQYTCTHLRLDGLFVGVLLAYRYHFSRAEFLAFAERHRWKLLAGGVAGLLPSFLLPLESWYISVLGLGVNWLAAGALLMATLAWQPRSGWFVRSLATIGRQSYATYLFHYTIGRVLLPQAVRQWGVMPSWPVALTIYLTLSLGTGALLTWLVERPFLALRDRWFPATDRPSATAELPPLEPTSQPAEAPAPVVALTAS